ncbi:MAG: hypothetical protein KGH49_02405 [Candidatus Micrarchaeota archaeon]|nr:hypothetical protein [Candidatus Micrarchaeota archaeon]
MVVLVNAADKRQQGDKAGEIQSRDVSNFENLAYKNVVQESWRGKLKHDKHLLDMVDDHATNMHRLLGSADYEVYGIDKAISNFRGMSKAEIKGYMKTLEGLAYFYNTTLGPELASTIITGITDRAKTLSSLGKYYRLMINGIESRIKRYDDKMGRENKNVEYLSLDLKFKESSLINRIFKKGELNSIRNKINSKKKRIAKMGTHASKHRRVLDSVNRTIKGGLVSYLNPPK